MDISESNMATKGKSAKVILMRFGLLGILLSRQSLRHLKYTNPSIGDDFIHKNGIFLVPFQVTKEAVALLKNIISGRLIWSVRHLELQNLSIISDSFERARMVQQFNLRS